VGVRSPQRAPSDATACNDLEAERRTALAELDAAEPPRPTADDVDLLDALPYLTFNLTEAPEQRELVGGVAIADR
jgi:hypothetical protein